MDIELMIILGVLTVGNIACAYVSMRFAKIAQEACRKSLGIQSQDGEEA